MKRGTENLLKFQHLQRDLGLAEYEAVGLLQTLWNKTDINCPRGDIGRLSNEDIAVILDWRRDPDELIKSLVRRGWIDEHVEHRLIIHDWPDHCENTTHRKVARSKEFFADGTAPNLSGLGKEQTNICEFYAREAEKQNNVITFEPTELKRDHVCPENSHPWTPTVTVTVTNTVTDTPTVTLPEDVQAHPPSLSLVDGNGVGREVRKKSTPPDYAPILEIWRAKCVPLGLSDVIAVEGKRKTHLMARAKDPKWMEQLPEAVEALISNPFNMGDNDRGWKADIDYLIRPGKSIEMIEKYRSRYGGSRATPSQAPQPSTNSFYQYAYDEMAAMTARKLAERNAQ